MVRHANFLGDYLKCAVPRRRGRADRGNVATVRARKAPRHPGRGPGLVLPLRGYPKGHPARTRILGLPSDALKPQQLQSDARRLYLLPDQVVEVHVGFIQKTKTTMYFQHDMAEGVGFEPTIRFPVYTLSKRAPSATRPPLRSTWNVRNIAGRPQVTTRA